MSQKEHKEGKLLQFPSHTILQEGNNNTVSNICNNHPIIGADNIFNLFGSDKYIEDLTNRLGKALKIVLQKTDVGKGFLKKLAFENFDDMSHKDMVNEMACWVYGNLLKQGNEEYMQAVCLLANGESDIPNIASKVEQFFQDLLLQIPKIESK